MHTKKITIGSTTWVSLINPSKHGLHELSKDFPQIHPVVLEELETPTIRPRVENYDQHLYMVLHFPKFIQGSEKSVSHEVDFIITQDTLITVQYSKFSSLDDFWHECEENSVENERYGKTPIHLLYYLLRHLFLVSLKELDLLQEEIDAMEEKVFTGHERKILEEISYLKRDILDFRRALKPQNLTLESLVSQGTIFFGEKVKPLLSDLLGEYLKLLDLLETHKETLDALYETNNALLTAKTNELVRAFTVLTFVTFIPTILTNIFSMNFKDIPLTGNLTGFWIILGSMVFFSWLMYRALRWKKLV